MSRPLLAIAIAVGVALSLSACAPESASPTSDPPASATATATPTPASTSTPTPSPTSTKDPAALPATCDQLSSADLVATLTDDIPPLNDPALAEFLSTENVKGLEVLNSGVPTLRCTWGAAGTPGLATTVARAGDADAGEIQQQLRDTGFACEDLSGGTVCRFSQQTIDQDDQVRTNGETHWFGHGFWVATHWVDYDPDGYTRDIAARLAA